MLNGARSKSSGTNTGRTMKTRRVIVGAVVVIVLLPLLLVTGGATLLPGCESCHLQGDFAQATAREAHASVACVRCHVSDEYARRLRFGAHAVSGPARALLSGDARSASFVDDTACLSCHAQAMESTLEANGILIDHTTCAQGTTCSACHSQTAHGDEIGWVREYTMDACLRCHGQQGGLVECDTCHVPRATRERLETGPWRVTHGARWEKTHGMGDAFTCAACHPQGYCDRCHGVGLPHGKNLMAEHVTLAADPAAQCLDCHKGDFCNDCHGIEMPHPEGFTPEHSSIIERDGDELCRTCHAESDCTTCHVTHVHPGNASSGGKR